MAETARQMRCLWWRHRAIGCDGDGADDDVDGGTTTTMTETARQMRWGRNEDVVMQIIVVRWVTDRVSMCACLRVC
eukprot:5524712-Lingulodinium_polyedra.AAC.1